MVPLIDSIRNEAEPDWDSVKPEKECVSFDPDIKSIRKETMEVRLVREQLEAQQGTASATTGSQEEKMVNMVQKTCDDEWQLQCDAWMTLQKECQNEVLGAHAILWRQFLSPAMQKRIEQPRAGL